MKKKELLERLEIVYIELENVDSEPLNCAVREIEIIKNNLGRIIQGIEDDGIQEEDEAREA